MLTVVCAVREHRGITRIFLSFEYDSMLNRIAKKIPGARWSRTVGAWHVPAAADSFRQIKKAFAGAAEIVHEKPAAEVAVPKKKQLPSSMASAPEKKLTPVKRVEGRIYAINSHAIDNCRQTLVLKAYSPSTLRTYLQELSQFLQALKSTSADKLEPARIKAYLQYCFEKLHLSENTLHSRINALKFYYEQVLHREKFFWEIPRPKKALQLPRFFSQVEVAALINGTKNLKHRVMLMLCYSTGLRVSEVVDLKTRNIDSNRMCILVQRAKGKKDRIVPLSPVLLVILREYATEYKPALTGYLFEGQEKGTGYNVRSLQDVLYDAKQRASVFREGGVHALRHSFATHLVDRGTDISMIQKLLGHNDIRTTLRYLHTSNKDLLKIVSPLDSLGLES